MEKSKPKMVMIYSHDDMDFLKPSNQKSSRLLHFLEGLARQEGWEFWWDEKMNNPLFDEEIKKRLNEADVIVCLVSQPFLNSVYITKVESRIANRRMRKAGILVVPIILSPFLEKPRSWFRRLHHFPKKDYLRKARNKEEIYKDIAEYISSCFKLQPFRDPGLLRTLRVLREESLTGAQIRSLTKDSCERAQKMVPDFNKRRLISREARKKIKENKGEPLSKPQLEELDRGFLAANSRNPDAKKVRWVLRCAGLHPQGKVVKLTDNARVT